MIKNGTGDFQNRTHVLLVFWYVSPCPRAQDFFLVLPYLWEAVCARPQCSLCHPVSVQYLFFFSPCLLLFFSFLSAPFCYQIRRQIGAPWATFWGWWNFTFLSGPRSCPFLPFACASSIQAKLGLPLSLYFLSAACSFRSGAADWQPESHLQPQAWLQIGTFYDKIRISSLSWETGSFLHSSSTLGRGSCSPWRAHIPLLTPVSAVPRSLTTSRHSLTLPVGDTALHCLTVTLPDPKLLSMQ